MNAKISASNAKTEHGAVDVFKLICSYLVIAIHTKPFQSIGILDDAVGMITRFAVPFFFMASAFFCFKKINSAPDKQKQKIISETIWRLIRFYAIWFVLCNLVSAITSQKIMSPLYYLKQFIFTTNGSPLWFMCALVWGIILVAIGNKLFGKKATLIISLFFYGSWLLLQYLRCDFYR